MHRSARCTAAVFSLALAAAAAAWGHEEGKKVEQVGKVVFLTSCAPAVQPGFELCSN